MTAREEVLRRIRTALADRPSAPEIPRDYRGAGETGTGGISDSGELVQLFAERVADYRAQVTGCTPAALATTIADRLAAHGIRSVAVDGSLPSEWLAASKASVRADEPELTVAELDATDGVVTVCRCGIATTGTIVLDHGPGQGRRALTLVPDYHLVVVAADRIVADVPDAIALLDAGSVQTWISGPSATSDIELDRVEGVHGPRRLDVVIVQSE